MRTTLLIATLIMASAVLAAPLATAETHSGDADKGSDVYESMQCFTCHPGGGNVINPSKPIKGKAFKAKYPEDSQIADAIRNGFPGTAMPAYSTDRLSDGDLNDLIAFIRRLTPGK